MTINREAMKDILAGLNDPKSGDAIAAMGKAMLERMQTNLPPNTEIVPMDDAFMRRALNSVYLGVKAVIESAGPDKLPALMFVFPGFQDKDTKKLAADVLPQGLGIVQDKAVIVEAAKRGVDAVEGKLFVVLVDEAWMFESHLHEGDSLVKKVESGEISISDLPMGKKREVVILNGLGAGVQYVMSNPIIKNEDGTHTVEEGAVMSTRDEGVTMSGQMVRVSKPQ